MSEETKNAGSGGEGNGAGMDPMAVALGLAGASREKADAFLDDQRAFIADQRHHLHEQLKQLHLDIWEKWLGVFLRLATSLVGVAAAVAVGLLVWGATNADGLRVEPFSVPPDLAARGLTGQVAAARVIDRLNQLQSQSNTARPARSYSNSWGGQGIKLEIPDTGISLAELDSWLRDKLGHETHVTGEIVRLPAGLSVTVRAGDEGVDTVRGSDADIDTLVGRSAESVYRMTQPYRYAIYLLRHENRPNDAAPIFRELALHGSPEDRRWSYNMWAQAAELAEGNNDLGLKMYQQALAANPDSTNPYANLLIDYILFGRIEEAVQTAKEAVAKGRPGNAVNLDRAAVSMLTGAYHEALRINAELLRNGAPGFPLGGLMDRVIKDQIGEHDLAAARLTFAGFPQLADVNFAMDFRAFPLDIDMAAGNWRGALSHEGDMIAYMTAYPHNLHSVRARFVPSLALAHARLGDFAAAERAIAPTPGDCYPCLIARAQIAELAGQHARAAYWFGQAGAAGPSLPFADEAEGRALLDRKQPDQAIADFTIANRKGPHFADPLEGWGEALMAENQTRQALAKFEEADKYAPNWGRLHLKWGEALAYAGKKEEAEKQFARAAALDLAPSEKSELKNMTHG